MRVAVVGAGVAGMTSALAISEAFPGIQVDVFAEKLSPETTGDGSAGLWGPYLLGTTPAASISKWAGRTHRWFEQLWRAGLAAETGISLLPVYRLTKASHESFGDPSWFKLVYGARQLTDQDLRKLSEEHDTSYKAGWQFVTYTSEPVRLLPWLMQKLSGAGVTFRRKTIRELGQLIDAGYDLIINCAGLGAAQLARDQTVRPIRGQVSRVKAAWAMHAYLVDDDDGNYIIPNADSVVLGGTHQENDFECKVRADDSHFIRNGCSKILPAIQKAQVLGEWVGLRPGRDQVRLEAEILGDARTSRGKEIVVIHNYGHGGSGVTLCWGCALDVLEIFRSIKSRNLHSSL